MKRKKAWIICLAVVVLLVCGLGFGAVKYRSDVSAAWQEGYDLATVTAIVPGITAATMQALPRIVVSRPVYITSSGTRYHKSWCPYLENSKIPLSRDEAEEDGYSPCSRCNP